MNESMSPVFSSIGHADLILDQGKSFRYIQSYDAKSGNFTVSFNSLGDLLTYFRRNTLNKPITVVSGSMPSLLLPEEKQFDKTKYPSFLPYQYVCRSLERYPFNIHFTISKELNDFLEQGSPGFKVVHESELFADYFKNQGSVLFAGFTDNVVSLFFKSLHSGIAYDQIIYQSSEDVLYFLLYYTKNLNMDPSGEKLIVSGDISLESALCRHLRVYFDALDYIPMLPEEMAAV